MTPRAASLLLAAWICGCGGASAPPQRVQAPSENSSPDVGELATGAYPNALPIEADDPSWGSALAPITVVVYLDLQCPFCAKGYQTIRELQDHYGQDQLRIVYKHYPLPFHELAVPAALTAQAAYQLKGIEGFQGFLDEVFSQRSFTQEELSGWVLQQGIAEADFSSVVRDPTTLERVRHDIQLAERVGVNATPFFFVNGHPLAGALPTGLFRRTIEYELKRVQSQLQEGLAPDRVYASRVHQNLGLTGIKKSPEEAKAELATLIQPGPQNPSRGPESAPVTIQVFAEFQCPYCARSARILRQLEQRFGNEIRIVWRNLPLAFHGQALIAANAAMEAHAQGGSRAFWKMHDALFTPYDRGEKPDLSPEALVALAAQLELDAERLKKAITEARHQELIDEDIFVARAAGIRATPGFMINGERIVGAQPLAAFEQIIERELAEAQ